MRKEKMAKKRKHERSVDGSSTRISFSASLPEDVHGVFAKSVCAVQLSVDPVADFRASMLEMIKDVGVRDWELMEELVYCYIALNTPDVHHFIAKAFLSLYSHPEP